MRISIPQKKKYRPVTQLLSQSIIWRKPLPLAAEAIRHIAVSRGAMRHGSFFVLKFPDFNGFSAKSACL